MISKQQFFKATNGYDLAKHAEPFLAYSDHAMVIDVYDGLSNFSAQIVFDVVTDEVFFVGVYDYDNNRAYARIADGYSKHDQFAYDDVKYTVLEDDQDWIDKATAIFTNQPYDTRIVIPLEIDDDALLEMFKMAHELDITFNQLVERALVQELNRLSATDFFHTDV